MKKLALIFVFLFFIVACNINEVDSPVFVYTMKNKLPENYLLNAKEEGASIHYNYTSKENAAANIDFKYLKEKNTLVFGLDTLQAIKSTFKPRNTEFKMYQSKQKTSNIRTYVFNKDHGLFASLGFKSHQLFLKDSITELEKETIFKGIFIELNKTYIQ